MAKIPYKCTTCKLKGHRLWRRYQTIASKTKLLCAVCVENETGKLFRDLKEGCSAIEWWVAAIPTEDEETFWGYTSSPAHAVADWYLLPFKTTTTLEEAHEELRELYKQQAHTSDSMYKLWQEAAARAMTDK